MCRFLALPYALQLAGVRRRAKMIVISPTDELLNWQYLSPLLFEQDALLTYLICK